MSQQGKKNKVTRQKALQTAGGALGVAVVPKTEEESADIEGALLAQLTDAYDQAAAGTKQAKDAAKTALEIVQAGGAAREAHDKLAQLAQHPALATGQGTQQALVTAGQQLTLVLAAGAKATAAVIGLREAFKVSISREQPRKVPAKGRGVQAMKDALAETLKNKKAYDDKVCTDIQNDIDMIMHLAEGAREAAGKIDILLSDWTQKAADHDRLEAERQQQAQALVYAGQCVTEARDAFGKAGTDKVSDTAAGLGIPVPDLAALLGEMTTAETESRVIDAGERGRALLRQIEILRNKIVFVTKLKQDYEALKQSTNGQLKTLTARLDGAKVADRSIIVTLQGYLTKANQQANGQEWINAADTLMEFQNGCEDADTLAKKFEYYSLPPSAPRLLAGTIQAIINKLPKGFTNTVALAEMESKFKAQCKVSRIDWITHLGIAGATVKVGTNDDHYTTFNDSVPVGTDISVHGHDNNDDDATKVCGRLFETVTPTLRIHSTYVTGGTRYHRYWSRGNAIYSNNVATPNPHNAMDVRYQQMVADMVRKTREVIAAYGRIGANKQGPKI